MIADIDVGNLERALAERNSRHLFLGGVGANKFRALFGQRPKFAGVFKPDAFDQLRKRKPVARHDRAELMAGRIPANVPAFENGDAGTKPRRLERNRETGEPGPDHADIDVEVER